MSNVIALPGIDPPQPPGESCAALVAVLERMLSDARTGKLRCLRAVGFHDDGAVVFARAMAPDNVFALLGALDKLIDEERRSF